LLFTVHVSIIVLALVALNEIGIADESAVF
jgi:hypothetical protein